MESAGYFISSVLCAEGHSILPFIKLPLSRAEAGNKYVCWIVICVTEKYSRVTGMRGAGWALQSRGG